MSLQAQLALGRLGPDEAVDRNRSLKRPNAQIWARHRPTDTTPGRRVGARLFDRIIASLASRPSWESMA